MYAPTLLCKKIHSFLLQRIFEELDPKLFNDISVPKESCFIEDGVHPAHYKCRIPQQYYRPTILCENQAWLFYNLFHVVEHLPLSDSNYQLIVYLLEHRMLYLKKESISDITREDILDAFTYVIQNADPETLIFGELKAGFIVFLNGDRLLEHFVDQILYFIEKVKMTKHGLDNALSMASAFNVFMYPKFHERIKKLPFEEFNLLEDFTLYYIYKFLLDKDHKYPLIDDITLQYATQTQKAISEETALELSLAIIDLVTLVPIESEPTMDWLSICLQEYEKRLGTFESRWSQTSSKTS
ncbi:uncharacterized protein J8A68_003403 [[Candida] subhashii]|uniref:Uncharacterized protein n=1 Tax=[Candida] subhashii TaxID=561895 RepID=A0A8J5QMA0_9ASCO|nr:uncharacterized protein J8A68_003403 [[Candida] subhashii]KAG7663060.1 hypothetical protein J8A68_003403 [[Candida] subhashii]